MKWWAFLIFPFALAATEFRPWFPNTLQLEGELAYAYEWFDSGDLNLIRGGLILSPLPPYCAQIECSLGETRQENFFFDAGRLSFRYLLFDDVVGDFVSLTFGGSATFSSVTARRNISRPYLGSIDWELHTAIGKEFANDCRWLWRVWGVGAAVITRGGSPLIWGKGQIEGNWCDQLQGGLHLSGLLNFGKRELDEIPRFHGYASVQSRAGALGAYLTAVIPFWCSLTLDYAYRFAAKNYPKRDHILEFSLLYPFGF